MTLKGNARKETVENEEVLERNINQPEKRNLARNRQQSKNKSNNQQAKNAETVTEELNDYTVSLLPIEFLLNFFLKSFENFLKIFLLAICSGFLSILFSASHAVGKPGLNVSRTPPTTSAVLGKFVVLKFENVMVKFEI